MSTPGEGTLGWTNTEGDDWRSAPMGGGPQSGPCDHKVSILCQSVYCLSFVTIFELENAKQNTEKRPMAIKQPYEVKTVFIFSH